MTENPIKMLQVDALSLTSNLDRAGYREMGMLVFSARGYDDAVKALGEKKPEIVVINLDYLATDAIRLCEFMRARDMYRATPIVVTSVQRSSPLKEGAMQSGASLFVEQPIPRTYFIEYLKQLLTKATRGASRIIPRESGLAKIEYKGGVFSALVEDLSETGMLVYSGEERLREGDICRVTFVIPGVVEPVEVSCEVVRVLEKDPRFPERKPGIGLIFRQFQKNGEKSLKAFLEKHARLGEEQRLRYYL